MRLNYFWKAVYKDGTIVSQYNIDGSENLFGILKLMEIVKFGLYPAPGKNLPIHEIVLEGDMRLIYYVKRGISLVMTSGESHLIPPVYHIGFQETINNRNYKTILVVDDSGNSTIRHEG